MLLYKKIRDSAQLPNWPRKEQVMMTMPQSFIDPYLSTRVIDCTEFAIEVSSDPDAKRVTCWTYKNRNTLEALVGIIPSGVYFCRRCTVDLYQTEESHHRVAFYRNSKKETASWLTKASQSMTFWTRWVRSWIFHHLSVLTNIVCWVVGEKAAHRISAHPCWACHGKNRD